MKIDTDVVVIAISSFNKLSQFGLEKSWVKFGVEINKRWIPIHDLTSVLRIKSARLLFWYPFSLKNTHTTATSLKSKRKTYKFWKDSLAYFTVEQQHLKV